MELRQLKQALAAEAKQAGICRQWHKKILDAPSKEYLLGLFVKGSDFAMLNSFPSERLRHEFDDIAPHFGVYLCGQGTGKNRPHMMALGASAVTAHYDDCSTGDIIAADHATLTIVASQHAYVAVEVYGKAAVRVKATDHARVLIIRHGGTVETQATHEATIRVIDKTITSYGNRQHHNPLSPL